MNIQENLKNFYDSEAMKYAQTRQKPWKEATRILTIIEEYINTNKKSKILELWCGSWRLTQQEWFKNLYKKDPINYTGVDISSELLKFAKKSFPSWNFVHMDMLQYIKMQKQESVDIILAFASFQHIVNTKEREILMHYFYQTLVYGGLVIMTNRAFSKWFRNKYIDSYKKSLRKYLYSFWKYDWRDIYVPWKWKDNDYARFYHLFSIKELQILAEQAGFIIEKSIYIDKKWQEVDSEKYANNSFIILRKWVYTSNS